MGQECEIPFLPPSLENGIAPDDVFQERERVHSLSSFLNSVGEICMSRRMARRVPRGISLPGWRATVVRLASGCLKIK